ncbi:MAG: Holliday junction branch migration protein RuvA [Eggerthellaceae bacterium]|nr:Holliday junction branch migration protein RuvA [Eggerthellaceae bacterium]
MIAFLEGTLAARTPTTAYVNVGGVGYAVLMSASALSKLPPVGEGVRVLTYLQVSENAGVALFGFLSEEEKALFERLITVSGVGPKVALAALSTFSPRALADAIAAQDTGLVSKIPGVGKKTASRIILELKGSLDAGIESLFASPADAQAVTDARLSGAVEALLSMGFTSAEADLALKGAPEGATEQALLQYALKRLGSR